MKIIPTWGYKDDGSAEIFDLKEGERLPDGWDAKPQLWNHPNTAHLYKRPEPMMKDLIDKRITAFNEAAEPILADMIDRHLCGDDTGGIAKVLAPKKRRSRPRKSKVDQ